VNNHFIGIMASESPHLVVGLLAIIKSGNCFVPINPAFPQERINFIIDDCQIRVLMVDRANYERAARIAGGNPLIEHLLCIDDLDIKDDPQATPGRSEGVLREQMCYMIYTSGSTGRPKGVPITHANLTPLLLWFGDYFGLDRTTRILQTLSYTFDFGVFEILSTIISGGTIYFLSMEAWTDLTDYVDFIREYEINTIHTTPSFFNSIVSLGQEIPTVKLLHFGGERLTAKMVNDAAGLLGSDYRIYNGYGPTETTINSSIFCITPTEKAAIDRVDTIPIGKPSAKNIIYILGEQGNLLPVGIAGEICIGGEGVAPGYLNRPELTAQRFGDDPYRPGHTLYHTGDLGRFLADGNIEYLGRIDDQVKVRGYRIELGEIESRLLAHGRVKAAAVTAREDQVGDKYLCAYYVPSDSGGLQAEMLREYLSAELPDYMIPSYFVHLDQMPLSSSGKLDRKALPEPEATTETRYVPPQNPLQEKIQEIWQEVLNRQPIGIDDDFFEIGGHSLKGIQIISAIHKEFAVKIPFVEIFQRPTIRGVSAYVKDARIERFETIPASEEREYYVLSSAQKRLYILQQMEPAGTVYNMPQLIRLADEVDGDKLEQTFRQLIGRHQSLRTSFVTVEEEPVQRVHKEVDFGIEYYNANTAAKAAKGREVIVKDFVRAFDLSKPPLLRVGLIETGHPSQEGKYELMVDMHHIVSDGSSLQILEREFRSLYGGGALPQLRLQYRDYACWQNSPEYRRSIKGQQAYWLSQFAGKVPQLNLPADFDRPAIQSFEGSVFRFEIGEHEAEGLREMARQEDVTLFLLLLALYYVLLSKLSGQEDIVVGTGTAGRNHPDLVGVIGMFVNTLALRNFPRADRTFKDFLAEVKERTLAALENQDYPFEDLVERAAPRRDRSGNPLVDTVFLFDSQENSTAEAGPADVEVGLAVFGQHISKFDVSLAGVDTGSRFRFSLEYCTRLFKGEMIEMMADCFCQIVSAVLENGEIKLADIVLTHEVLTVKSEIPDYDFAI
jgi:amino acid adenylation domain-containing protein